MIGIINYGMGNIKSVENALAHINQPSFIVQKKEDFRKATKLILPGVGAFSLAMQNLEKIGFDDMIKESCLENGKPLLGICLGMQLLLSSSEEFGYNNGLNLIQGRVLNFKTVLTDLRVPHVGWNNVKRKKNSLISENMDNRDYYFVHSFYCHLEDNNQVSGTTSYGIDFHSSLEHKNIYGCQFHPEKSQEAVLEIFKNYCKLEF